MEEPNLKQGDGLKLRSKKLIIVFSLIFVLLLGGIFSLFYFSEKINFDFGKENLNSQNQGSGEIKENLFKDFSELIINTANAKDNFSLLASDSDSTGVSAKSSYVLSSQESLSLSAVKENIKISPEINYQVKEISNFEWEIVPEDTLPANEIVKIALNTSSLDEGGQQESYEYSWAFQVKDSFKVLHSVPRHAGVAVPANTGIELTFSHEGFFDYDKYFKIEPQVPGAFEVHFRTLVFVPANVLGSGQIYTVTIDKNLPVQDSQQRLTEDYVFSFETRRESSNSSWISVYDRSIEVDPNTAPIIKVYSYNAPRSLQAIVYRFASFSDYLKAIEERDKLPWWSYSKEDYLFDKSNLFEVLSFEAEIKSGDNSKFIVFPSALEKGFYLVELSNADQKAQVYIQSSDLAVYSSLTKSESIVWVNNLRTKEPEPGVEIKLINTDASAKTDSQGVAVFNTPNELKEMADNYEIKKRYYLEARKGEDVILLPASKLYRNYWWAGPSLADDYWNYLYTDRPRYQSSDVIKYWGVLKDREEKKIDKKVTVSLYKQGYVDYYYRPVRIFEQEVELSKLGSFSSEIELKNIKPDYYTLELAIDGEVVKRKYITVKPYIKPAYSLSLESSKSLAYAGEEVELKAKASFFEGTPVPNLKLVISTPEGKNNVVTDENGEAIVSFSKKYYDCGREYGCWPDREYFYVEPENSEIAEIKESASVRYYGPNVYLETSTTYPEKGQAELKIVSKKYDLEKIVPDNWWEKRKDDELAPDTEFSVIINEITYTKEETGTRYDYINKKSYKTYSYNKNTKLLEQIKLKTDVQGEYIFKQEVKPQVSYEISLKMRDKQGRIENSKVYFYYYNGLSAVQYGNWRYNYYHLEILNKKYKFHLGEQVETVFMNGEEALPDRDNSYLFLQLRNGLQEYKIGHKSAYNFGFNKSDIPNINLAGVYFDGRTYVKTSSGYYGKSIEYDRDDSRLKIIVEPDKEKYAPGEDVNLDIFVTDKDDKPVTAEVNLNLVDEAYYAVISDSASPLETIYHNVGPGILLSKSTHESLANSKEMVEKGGCFLAGTRILMADKSYKEIEDIKEGDKVLTFSDPFDKQVLAGEVKEVWEGRVGEYLIVNNNLKLTPDHQVYSNYRFVDAGLLSPGDWLLNSKGEEEYIDSLELIFAPVTVYNLKIDPQHTFFANDFYVHNQEKGGGAREFFTDAAFFKVLKTNQNGRAKTSLKLPDNITSWRITAQGISDELEAGVSVSKIPVSLPVFAEISIGPEYLSQDKPSVRLRAFGTELNSGDKVEFSVFSKSLGMEDKVSLSAKAFAPVFYSLPELKPGKHELVYSLDTDKGSDAVKLPLKVLDSRLEIQKALDEELSLNTKITSPTDQPFVLAFLDKGQNALFKPLLGLGWTWGDRLDQQITKKEAIKILNKYYDFDRELPGFEAQNYQLNSGGLSLLPYSSEDLELSLRISSLNPDYFDKEALAQYFFRILENRTSTQSEITFSLCGLAGLNKPVVAKLNTWIARDDLSTKERIYLALALAKLGQKETAQEIYFDILVQYGEEKEPYIIIKEKDENDLVFEATSLMAYLGAILQDDRAFKMFDFVRNNQKLYGEFKNSEQLFGLEKISYIKNELPNLNPKKARVAFEFLGEEREANITGGEIYAFEVRPENVDTLVFKEVEGDIVISRRYMSELKGEIKESQDIGLRRSYFVNGVQTSDFKESDLIEVRIYPEFLPTAIDGDYQITDILPSGLAPATRLYSRGRTYGCQYWYPYNTDGQKVKFRINKNWKDYYCGGDYFKYYARVAGKGFFVAESALLQSYKNPDYLIFSNDEKVNIK